MDMLYEIVDEAGQVYATIEADSADEALRVYAVNEGHNGYRELSLARSGALYARRGNSKIDPDEIAEFLIAGPSRSQGGTGHAAWLHSFDDLDRSAAELVEFYGEGRFARSLAHRREDVIERIKPMLKRHAIEDAAIGVQTADDLDRLMAALGVASEIATLTETPLLDFVDPFSFEAFGGDQPDGTGNYSWDATRLLRTNARGKFILVPRPKTAVTRVLRKARRKVKK